MENKDFTIIIPVRIDSTDRLRNLHIIINSLKLLNVAQIIILEADSETKIKHINGVRKIFIEDYSSLFFHTKYINVLCNMVDTEYMGVWDCDVIVPLSQIKKAIELLRNHEADMVYPYNGYCYDVNNDVLEQYIQIQNESMLMENIDNLQCFYGRHTCGGAFMVNRHKYIKAGGDNEKFIGWGPEDLERYKRWEIKGYRVCRTEGVIFHLHHTRGENSQYYDSTLKRITIQALLETCRIKGDYDNVSIPVYINVSKYIKRQQVFLSQFEKRNEFKPIFIDSCKDDNANLRLWKNIVRSVRFAKEQQSEFIIFSDETHIFTAQYSPRYLISQIFAANKQNADILLGGVSDFGTAVPIGYCRYWVDKFYNSRFIIFFNNSYDKILNFEFKVNDSVDTVLSTLFTRKIVLYPFISKYEHITLADSKNKNRGTEMNTEAIKKLTIIDKIYKSYSI